MSDYIYTLESELKKVKADRDELLEMLESVMDEWRYGSHPYSDGSKVYETSIELISKVKGER
jgi:hypothetical protein